MRRTRDGNWWADYAAIAERAGKGGEDFVSGADHDVVFLHLTAEDVPEDSPDGKTLEAMGCRVEDGISWAFFT